MKTFIVIAFAVLSYALNLFLLRKIAKEENLNLKKRQYILLACLYLLVVLDLLSLSHLAALPVIMLSEGLLMMSLITASIDFFSFYIYDMVLFGYSLLHLGIIISQFQLDGLKNAVLGLLVGLAFYGLIYFVAKLIYGKEAFGFGDVLYLGAIGVVLGPWWTAIVGVMAFYLALFLIILNKLAKRSTGLKSELPFGPAIALAVYFFVLHQPWVFAVYDGFQEFIGRFF